MGSTSLCRAGAFAGLALAVLASDPGRADAQQWSACFAGRDHLGQPTHVVVLVERYNDWFEIAGQITSSSVGRLRFKADGHSGAGRMFSGHEHEAGGVYIDVLDLNDAAFVLEVEGYGVFRFQRSRC